MTFALVVGLLGFVVWWGGYYAAMVVARRAGLGGVDFALAIVLGLCGCGGIPILSWYWSRVQSATFRAIADGDDASYAAGAFPKFRSAAMVAGVGMVLQITGGYMLPERSEDDYGSYADTYEDDYAEDDYAEDDTADDDTADDYADDDDYAAGDAEDDADEASADVTADEAVEPEATEDEALEETAEPEASSTEELLVALSTDRRHAFLLAPGASRGEWVAWARRGRWARVVPGAALSVTSIVEGDVRVASASDPVDADAWNRLPRPTLVRDGAMSSLDEHVGEYVLLPSVRSDDGRSVTLADGGRVSVHAPRGALTRDTEYTAVRGILVGPAPGARGRSLELWIPRESDVIP